MFGILAAHSATVRQIAQCPLPQAMHLSPIAISKIQALHASGMSATQIAKRFDLLILRLQLAVLHAEPGFARLRDQVKQIAVLLEDKSSIPMVQAQMPLIQELQTDAYWQDVNTPMLETVRKRLRALVSAPVRICCKSAVLKM